MHKGLQKDVDCIKRLGGARQVLTLQTTRHRLVQDAWQMWMLSNSRKVCSCMGVVICS